MEGGRWSKKAKFCKRSLWTPPYGKIKLSLLFLFYISDLQMACKYFSRMLYSVISQESEMSS